MMQKPQKINKIPEKINWAGAEVENRLFLAPLAGPGSLPFRLLCEDFGAALTVTELVSARSIIYDEKWSRNHRYLNLQGLRKPAAIQIFAFDPADIAPAVQRLMSHPNYQRMAFLDINMGCPVKKVVKTGAGSALMLKPDLAARIVEAAAESLLPYGKKVTVKMRSGWDAEHINAPSLAKLLASAGASAIVVHARTREQLYSGRADWRIFPEVKAAVDIPVAANGDLSSFTDCQYVLEHYGMDACMLGRAALGQPWIFRSILEKAQAQKLTPLSSSCWLETVKKHYFLLKAQRSSINVIPEFRSSLAYYLKGVHGAAAYRREAMALNGEEELLAFLVKVAEDFAWET